MKKIALATVATTVALAGGALAYNALAAPKAAAAAAGAGDGRTPAARTDCPGTIICPLTGEEICKDQCPLCAPKKE